MLPDMRPRGFFRPLVRAAAYPSAQAIQQQGNIDRAAAAFSCGRPAAVTAAG